MRNQLPKRGSHRNEPAIINLDNRNGPETHWAAYKNIIIKHYTLTVSVIPNHHLILSSISVLVAL